MASNLLPRCQAQLYLSNPFSHPQFTAPTPSPAAAWAGLKNEGHRTGTHEPGLGRAVII